MFLGGQNHSAKPEGSQFLDWEPEKPDFCILKLPFGLYCSVSCVWFFVTPWTAACQTSLSFTISSSLLKFMSLNLWCHPTISSSVILFSSCPQSFPASEFFPMSWLFASGGQNIRASASQSVLLVNIQGWFPLGLTGWWSCCSRDSQESSPAPQFKSINSLAFSLLYGPALTSIHDSWENHSFD